METRLMEELESFQQLWQGGYFEGDPLHPISRSSYGDLGYISTLHATYLRCIKPYVRKDTVAVEIGPGRGAWTRAMLSAKEVYALDALPEEHNGFYEYLGYPSHVKYFQVADFRCHMLPENHFDFMFSFGCLCHVSFEGIQEYAVHLFPKLKSGSNCFWMVADYEKYNCAVEAFDTINVKNAIFRRPQRNLIQKSIVATRRPPRIDPDKDNHPSPGRWYHAGIQRTCDMLERIGYLVHDPDVGTCLRDPILHFVKP